MSCRACFAFCGSVRPVPVSTTCDLCLSQQLRTTSFVAVVLLLSFAVIRLEIIDKAVVNLKPESTLTKLCRYGREAVSVGKEAYKLYTYAAFALGIATKPLVMKLIAECNTHTTQHNTIQHNTTPRTTNIQRALSCFLPMHACCNESIEIKKRLAVFVVGHCLIV